MIRAEFSGETAPELLVTNCRVTLLAGTYQVRFDGEITDQGSYELGVGTDVRTMLLRGSTGTNAGRVIPCIYQLTGDRMRVCYGLDGVAPTEFATREGQPRYLATYRRNAVADTAP